MLRRDSLRAQRDFYAPMTEGTQIRYAAAQTPVSGKYGAEVKKRLTDIGSGVGRTAQRVGTRKAEMRKTEDPTRSAQASFYAPMTEKKDDRLSKIAGAAQGVIGRAQDAIGRGISQVTSAAGEAADQYRRDRESDKAERDKYRATQASERSKYRQSTSEQIAGISQSFDKRYSADKAERDKQYGALQGDIKSVRDQVSTVGTQLGEVKKQITTANTPKKAVEVATKAKEEASTRKTGGGGRYNTVQARAKRTARQNKAKALARKRRSSTAGRGFGRSVGRGGRRGGSAGTRGSRSRGATGSASRRSTSRSRSSNTSRSRRSGRSTSRSRGGVSRGRRGRRGGRRGRRGGRRCDLRCKVNISLLTSMNLMRDDLAEVAYFVKELQEIN